MHRIEKIQDTRHKNQDSRLKTKGTRQTPILVFDKNTCVVFGLSSLVFILLLSGCAEEQQYGAVEPICLENVNKLKMMETAEDVLAKMHFTIEKADAESGFIRTRPLAGAQFFEFWRSDNVGPDNWLESNLHSIRRIAELNIREQDDVLFINCEVQKYRLSIPEHQVSSSARAYQMFSKSNSVFQNLRLNPEQKAGMAWIDLGKDKQLAAEILKRIEQQIDSKRATSDEI